MRIPSHYKSLIFDNSIFIKNTMLYCTIAAFIDIVLAFFISYIVLRTNKGRHLLDYIAMSAIAIPGLVLGIGYLRTFNAFTNPLDDKPLASWWFMIVLILAVRRLPYALRAANAALMQISKFLEESAESLGAKLQYLGKF